MCPELFVHTNTVRTYPSCPIAQFASLQLHLLSKSENQVEGLQFWSAGGNPHYITQVQLQGDETGFTLGASFSDVSTCTTLPATMCSSTGASRVKGFNLLNPYMGDPRIFRLKNSVSKYSLCRETWLGLIKHAYMHDKWLPIDAIQEFNYCISMS